MPLRQRHNLRRAALWLTVNLPFPESNNNPSFFLQAAIDQPITGAIAFDLLKPIRLICFVLRASTVSPPITVPEFTVAEDRYSLLHDDEVWFPEDRILFPITNTGTP